MANPKMLSLLLGAVLLVLSLCVSAAGPALPPPPPPPPAPGYALVVFQWPMGLCMVSDCIQNVIQPQEFRLHGVWMQQANHQPMEFCPTSEHWSKTPLKETTMARRLARWTSFLKDWTNWTLWQHEWNKHGTCSHMSVKNYFNASLSLFENKYQPILTALRNHQITPTFTQDMNRADVPRVRNIFNALLTDLNLIPIIHCQQSRSNTRFLVEIRLCATPDLTAFQNCTTTSLFPGCGYKPTNPKAIFYYNPRGLMDDHS